MEPAALCFNRGVHADERAPEKSTSLQKERRWGRKPHDNKEGGNGRMGSLSGAGTKESKGKAMWKNPSAKEIKAPPQAKACGGLFLFLKKNYYRKSIRIPIHRNKNKGPAPMRHSSHHLDTYLHNAPQVAMAWLSAAPTPIHIGSPVTHFQFPISSSSLIPIHA